MKNLFKNIELQSPIVIKRTPTGIRLDFATEPSKTRKIKNKIASCLEAAARRVRA